MLIQKLPKARAASVREPHPMPFVGFLITLYVFIAVLAAIMTYCEQSRTKGRSPLFTALGFAACAFWPLALVTIAVSAQQHKA